ncbi:hypothetical protein [Micromonospora echinofusca]|uniref:MYXO-CTERM domain-containing protein n=1 Tax=Micromonospora echinofusca TaxID=47858 RepID=A0ABS3W1Z8_MICEH|nr:hypothetical protein [Micromonospora echinofusca]MBO4210761.1 hypothetical protein [Micromonospora echinofusca]
MFGSNLLDRRKKTERIADQAWQQLVSAVNSAGDSLRDTARSTGRGTSHLADEAGDRVGAAADEAWHRATRAFDALAGRRPGLPWAWLVGAAVVGAAIGWAAGSAARAVADRDTDLRRVDDIEFVDVDRPDAPVSLDVDRAGPSER